MREANRLALPSALEQSAKKAWRDPATLGRALNKLRSR